MLWWICICIFCSSFAFVFQRCHGHSANPKLLLVSFDGFRWDYLDLVKKHGKRTPHFDSLIENGVQAEHGMKNVFVTKTFPNHYSLATGMYEENHGVVGNVMYDTRWNETFDKNNKSVATATKWWSNGTTGASGPEPIWITNQKGEQNLFQRRSGVMFWPGSEVKIRGMRPYRWMEYDNSYPNETRIENIVNWFSAEEDPINLGLLYFSEPDHLGHNVGPDSLAMIDMIVALDGLVGLLIQKLKDHDLFDHMNIIITSDHGMAKIPKGNIIDLSKYLQPINDFISVTAGNSPGIHIIPKPGKLEEVYTKLKRVAHLSVYKKEEMPRDYHYQYNTRILDLVVMADVGWDVYTNVSSHWDQMGNHGYNNSADVMHPFFIAHGPAFRKNFLSKDMFNNVDVYPLMCHILDLKPGPFDGSLANIAHILESKDNSMLNITIITSMKVDNQDAKSSQNHSKVLLSVMFAATVAGVFCVAACRIYRITKHWRRHLVLPLNMIDGQTHLLVTDDEEIP